jgi:hypothetical protein
VTERQRLGFDMRKVRWKRLLAKAAQFVAVLALSFGVFVVAMGLLPPRVEAWLRASPGDEHGDEIPCTRCGGTMEVRNRLAGGLKVYACRDCEWALWPDGAWKAPAPKSEPPATWRGDR